MLYDPAAKNDYILWSAFIQLILRNKIAQCFKGMSTLKTRYLCDMAKAEKEIIRSQA